MLDIQPDPENNRRQIGIFFVDLGPAVADFMHYAHRWRLRQIGERRHVVTRDADFSRHHPKIDPVHERHTVTGKRPRIGIDTPVAHVLEESLLWQTQNGQFGTEQGHGTCKDVPVNPLVIRTLGHEREPRTLRIGQYEWLGNGPAAY